MLQEAERLVLAKVSGGVFPAIVRYPARADRRDVTDWLPARWAGKLARSAPPIAAREAPDVSQLSVRDVRRVAGGA